MGQSVACERGEATPFSAGRAGCDLVAARQQGGGDGTAHVIEGEGAGSPYGFRGSPGSAFSEIGWPTAAGTIDGDGALAEGSASNPEASSSPASRAKQICARASGSYRGHEEGLLFGRGPARALPEHLLKQDALVGDMLVDDPEAVAAAAMMKLPAAAERRRSESAVERGHGGIASGEIPVVSGTETGRGRTEGRGSGPKSMGVPLKSRRAAVRERGRSATGRGRRMRGSFGPCRDGRIIFEHWLNRSRATRRRLGVAAAAKRSRARLHQRARIESRTKS